MSHTFPGDDESDDEGVPDALEQKFRADTDLLIERYSALEDEARKLGLYVDDHQISSVHTHVGGACADRAGLVAQFSIGDLAFSKRVQDPAGYDFDQSFRELELDAQTDEWLDARARIQKNIAAGRDALDDGDDEEHP